jgi:hypothetical protein
MPDAEPRRLCRGPLAPALIGSGCVSNKRRGMQLRIPRPTYPTTWGPKRAVLRDDTSWKEKARKLAPQACAMLW